MIEIKADTPLLSSLTGLMSAYVSSLDKSTLTLLCPSSTSTSNRGRSLYASGPTTRSTNFSSSRRLSFIRSAIHPNIPIIKLGLLFFSALNDFNRFLTVDSAFSLIEQVFNRIRLDSSKFLVV